MRKLLPALICLAGAIFVGAPAAKAEVVEWLYEVEVPVASQTEVDRLAASKVALLELLTRMTGLNHIPRLQAVSAALRTPELYYNQFRFVEVTALDDEGLEFEELHVAIQFERASVLRLLKDAALPIWRANRPKLVAWVVVQTNDGVREILGADSPSDLAVAVQSAAQRRGLPLVLPLLDLEDQLQVDPAAVWGRLSVVLDSASERYDADIVLVGRVQAMTSGSWSIGWEFWIDGELLSFAGQSSDIAQLGGDAVNFLADQLAQRFAVLGRLPQDIRVGVSGIRSAADYGNLLGYLGSLEFVDEVSLIRVQADRLGLIVTTRADPEQLLRMFKVDRYLSDVGPSMDNPSDVELMWQSR